ncbi:MAG TPA: hypothetical protein VFV07_08660 [Rhizomicrobium sp.]|nr:hypothetical protein [Rhizomicrobium sp.]
MIVSYSRKFIFVKTKKTAGSTIEAVLAAACTDGDIITQEDGYRHPGSEEGIDEEALRRQRQEAKLARGGERRARKHAGDFYSHMSAQEARAQLDPAFWAEALKLTAERHPYEKAVSQAFYRASRDGSLYVDRHLDRVLHKGTYAGHPFWTIDGKVAVDAFLRQESLKADLDQVGARLGIAIPETLPQLKARTRPDRRPAREILSAAQKRVVQETCRVEFEILGYEP